MPRQKLTEKQKETMRRRILTAAEELLLEEGPDSLSIRAIADRVGVSHMVLYTYFKNRADIMSSLSQIQHEHMIAQYPKFKQRALEGDMEEVIRKTFKLYVKYALSHPQFYKFYMVQPVDPEKDDGQPNHLEENLDQIASLIELGIQKDIFIVRDSKLAAMTCFNLINAPLILYFVGHLRDTEFRDRAIDEAINVIIGYLFKG
jgi:AcrR family transcriptional regulator